MEDIVPIQNRFDGDLVLLIDNKTMMEGVHQDIPVVIDIEDKITAIAERDTPEARLGLILRTLDSGIGEISNLASCYHNKNPKDNATKKKYDDYISFLSIGNGKEIERTNCLPMQ